MGAWGRGGVAKQKFATLTLISTPTSNRTHTLTFNVTPLLYPT